jgi:hypothetical protein
MNGQPRRIAMTAAVLLLMGATGACHHADEPCTHQALLPARNGAKVSIAQGIWGDVWFWAGNFQPPCITGTVAPVSREVLVHDLTPYDSVTFAARGPTFYSAIRTPLIATIRSDASGFFQVQLPPGTYSIFTREDTLFYANGLDGHGNIWPVSVVADSVTGIRFDINYEASW